MTARINAPPGPTGRACQRPKTTATSARPAQRGGFLEDGNEHGNRPDPGGEQEGEMPTKSGNPAASGKANGAKSKKDKHDNAPVIDDAQGALHLSKTEKAVFVFAFLDRLKRDPEMKPIDAVSALWIVGLVGDDLEFFMAAKKLAELIRRVKSVAEDSLGRLRQGGYLIHIYDADQDDRRAGSKPQGGRYANTYRLAIPDTVSPEKSGETAKPKKGVSPGKSGRVSPGKSGTITLEDTLEGGRAPGRASANTRKGVDVDDEEDHHDNTAQRALGPVDPAPGAAADVVIASALNLAAEYGIRDEVPDAMSCLGPDAGEDRPDDLVTLADLDRRDAEEAEEEGPLPITIAAAALHRLHGGALDDPDGHADDMLEGYLADDADAARQAAITTAKLLLAAGPKDQMLAVWRAHQAILSRMLTEYSGDRGRAADAIFRFGAAVGDAASIRIARRKAEMKAVTEEAADA